MGEITGSPKSKRPARAIDLTGQRFGELVVVKRVGITTRRQTTWLCKCDCGNEKPIRRWSLISGRTKTCGCGLKKSYSAKASKAVSHKPEYSVWEAMIQRCNNPNCSGYPDYGGRGIAVCERWRSFTNFHADMGDRPGKQFSLDRIDNDGNYEPNNCRWTTRDEQASNTRKNVMVVYNDQRMTASQMARLVGVSVQMIYYHMRQAKKRNSTYFELCNGSHLGAYIDAMEGDGK